MTAAGGAVPPATGDVLVVGDLNVDVVVAHDGPVQVASDTAARVTFAGGGSAANTAAWLGAMGAPVRLVSARGDDVLGTQAEADLASVGARFVGPVLHGVATGVCVVLVGPDGERTMFPDRGANDRLPAVAVTEQLRLPTAWVHVSGYALLHEGSRHAGQVAVGRGRAVGATVSVDAASTGPIRAVGAETFLDWLRGADLLFANDEEVAALGGLEAVLDAVGAVVAKHGAAGATWTDGRTSHTVPGEVVQATDTTGAGDAFAAGWIAAATTGASALEALAAAVRAGAAAVTRAGARPAAPTAAATGGAG